MQKLQQTFLYSTSWETAQNVLFIRSYYNPCLIKAFMSQKGLQKL